MDERSALTGKERSALRGRAHCEKPVVQIGKGGLDDAVLAAAEEAIAARELIKVRIGRSAPLPTRTAAARLATALGAELLAVTGNVAVLFRKQADAPAEDASSPGRGGR